ncbi:MAG: transcription-repair coupling factor [Deltaproteobacteria bacterium]|nr:transcription-repair coupling factor [Deltaproteobacteria bacterium]
MKSDLRHVLSQNKEVLLKGFYGAGFAQALAAAHRQTKRPILLIVDDQKKAEQIRDEICFFSGSTTTHCLPAYDVMPYYGLSPHHRVMLKNLEVLYLLSKGKADFVIAPAKALLRRVLPKAVFESLVMVIAKKDLVDRTELINKLVVMGYERNALVEDPGQFAVRGDIIDVFSPQYADPVRINLFDIEVENIRFFEPSTQRTKEAVSEVKLIPAREIFLNYLKQKTTSLEPSPADVAEIGIASPLINEGWKTCLKKRADERQITKDKRDQIEEFVQNKIYFRGIEFFLPLFYNETGSFFDYLSRDTVIALDLDNRFGSTCLQILEDLAGHHEESEHIESIFAPQEIFLTPIEAEKHLAAFTCLYRDFVGGQTSLQTPHKAANTTRADTVQKLMPERVTKTYPGSHEIDGQTESNLFIKTKILAKITQVHNLAPLAGELNQKRLEGYSCFIVCRNEVQRERMRDLLKRFDLPLRAPGPEFSAMSTDPPAPSVDFGAFAGHERLITLMVGEIHEGFISHGDREWWLTDEEVFGKKTKRAVSQKNRTVVFSSFSDLAEGDYIIHMDHGVGIYNGLVKLDFDIHKNDFMLLEYLGGDRLYVPVDKLNRVQRFFAEEGVTPQIDKLGGKTWIKTKIKAKRAARKLAKELLVLQAKRESLKGHAFNPNTEMVEEFASGFEFEETPDQLSTIEDVLKDMEKDRPMDRLVCGDVGYGKTEVALRAAYKAVCDHKQVAILVPTTVLAFQHHATFSERLKNYPVRVGLLSRFRSLKEQQDVIRLTKSGGIDILVGTHRLLSKDVQFTNLGLLVIDEEHRFGVTHKEQIKKIKSLVDVITLTATPIPRTLNFALNGIRDLSIINTPPVDRLAVRTYTCYFDEITIRDALLKEVRRGGQVYFVHNRVRSIEKMTAQIAKLVPEARCRHAHGQMAEGDLEEIMIDFMNHKFDVLVCTTIIESGLDIPNANTMIINRADGLGLAQLYQLRGRVGRSSRQAYCYLVIPQESLITEKAKKRLAAIQRFTELGSGFKVASRDLEIRGAGNILGEEQSGHIAAIGYDLYVHLLQQAVNELQNTALPEDFEPEIVLNIAARIPDDFIMDQQLRLVLYKQVSSCEALDDVAALRSEWEDRFGVLPDEVVNLIELIKVKIHCKKILVSEIKAVSENLIFGFHQNHTIDTGIFISAVKKNPKKFSITRDGRLVIKHGLDTDKRLLEYVIELLEKFEAAAASSY